MDNSLLKISSKIHPEQVELLEVFLYEEAPSPWVLEGKSYQWKWHSYRLFLIQKRN